jgi:hypothetical protein
MSEIASKSEEQQLAEGEVDGFRQALGPFVVAAETTRMAMLFTDAKDPDNPIIFANTSFLALTGYQRATSNVSWRAMPPGRRAQNCSPSSPAARSG